MNVRGVFLLALAAPGSVLGQSVVSAHSGVVYFFAGTVYVGDERLEQKFGKFPNIDEGRELRTAVGRAEVLLTPGVILRVAENSSVRMLSNRLSDTRVELLSGSVIVESADAGKGTSTEMIHRNWTVRMPHDGVYRIDAEPAQVRTYKGVAEVFPHDSKEPVPVKEGELLPLAEVLLTERSPGGGKDPLENDSFKSWAMSRSQAVAADNATSAGIIDDPSQIDNAGIATGGYTYFPPGAISSLGIASPYGLSFWSPYQSVLSSIYVPPYAYLPVYGVVRSGWTGGTTTGLYPNPSHQRPIYPTPIAVPWRSAVGTTVHPGSIIRPGAIHPGVGGMTVPRPTINQPPRPAPRSPAPNVGGPHVSAPHPGMRSPAGHR